MDTKYKIVNDSYVVHFDTSDKWIQFEAYPIWEASDGTYEYLNKNSDHSEKEFNENCLCSLKGSYCWRGIWEGRIYFQQEEYWIQDVEEISDLLNRFVIPHCKEVIMKKDPHNFYDE